MNYLVKYYNEIEKGNIIVGQELKEALNQLIIDLDNPTYIFDEKPGQLRIDFIETFCKHTKSPFNGMPFILELWEKALLQTAYGFKMADSGLRRFNEVILLIARKNGKTTFVAGIDLAEFFLSSGGVDIVCASNTTEQANILFEEINNMREQSPALSKDTRSKKNIFHIYSPKTKNKINVRLARSVDTPKSIAMPGRAGRYRSVDNGTKALRNAMSPMSPFLPRYFCLNLRPSSSFSLPAFPGDRIACWCWTQPSFCRCGLPQRAARQCHRSGHRLQLRSCHGYASRRAPFPVPSPGRRF